MPEIPAGSPIVGRPLDPKGDAERERERQADSRRAVEVMSKIETEVINKMGLRGFVDGLDDL